MSLGDRLDGLGASAAPVSARVAPLSLGSRLLGLGGARVTGALALACLLLIGLLLISVTANVLQVRGKARAVGVVLSQLAAADARAQAQIAACSAVNGRQSVAITTLQDELQQCRGDEQNLQQRWQLALRERDRARRAVDAEIEQRRTTIDALVKTHDTCAARAICRDVSDELLRSPSDADH